MVDGIGQSEVGARKAMEDARSLEGLVGMYLGDGSKNYGHIFCCIAKNCANE